MTKEPAHVPPRAYIPSFNTSIPDIAVDLEPELGLEAPLISPGQRLMFVVGDPTHPSTGPFLEYQDRNLSPDQIALRRYEDRFKAIIDQLHS